MSILNCVAAPATASYIIREATPADAAGIAPLLRDKDRREVEAITGKCPETVLPQSFVVDPPRKILFAETTESKQPILIGGVRSTPDRGTDSAAVWMVGTPLLDRYSFTLAREARRHVDSWGKSYRRLWNTAWEGNDLHVDWLRFLGFSITDRFEHRGLPFITFEKITPCVELTLSAQE